MVWKICLGSTRKNMLKMCKVNHGLSVCWSPAIVKQCCAAIILCIHIYSSANHRSPQQQAGHLFSSQKQWKRVVLLAWLWGWQCWYVSLSSCRWSNTLPQTEISQQFLHCVAWNFVKMFMVLRCWILLILAISWLFFQHHPEIQICGLVECLNCQMEE